MTIQEIQAMIDEYYYWDMRVESLENNFFGDEIKLVYDDNEGNDIIYLFTNCYKSVFDHEKQYDKLQPVSKMTKTQIPYFMQDVKVSETMEGNIHYYICKINMYPLELEIWCKKIDIIKQTKINKI